MYIETVGLRCVKMIRIRFENDSNQQIKNE
jgi:hypothetical protein